MMKEIALSGSIPACAGEPGSCEPSSRLTGVHPRVRGGARIDNERIISRVGPSPRVRGSLFRLSCQWVLSGSIPACAGEPSETPHITAANSGPSPRVRGSPRTHSAEQVAQRSIPACAGEPPCAVHHKFPERVHPRVCGGAAYACFLFAFRSGPSPRVRGSQRRGHRQRRPPGSIPACAGEPSIELSRHAREGVHPRVCGGAFRSGKAKPSATGPSPRVRGSLRGLRRDGCPTGSIPACAGEPAQSRNLRRSKRVHPRVCGGAESTGDANRGVKGPSPRVRGSPSSATSLHRSKGSIPACAGEPATFGAVNL